MTRATDRDFSADELHTEEPQRCPWCKGTGSNRAEYGPVPCPDCDGSGYIQPEEDPEIEEEAAAPEPPPCPLDQIKLYTETGSFVATATINGLTHYPEDELKKYRDNARSAGDMASAILLAAEMDRRDEEASQSPENGPEGGQYASEGEKIAPVGRQGSGLGALDEPETLLSGYLGALAASRAVLDALNRMNEVAAKLAAQGRPETARLMYEHLEAPGVMQSLRDLVEEGEG